MGEVATIDVLEIVVVLIVKFAPVIELCFFTLHVSNFFLKSGVKLSSKTLDAETDGPAFGGQLLEQDSSLPIRLNAVQNLNSFL